MHMLSERINYNVSFGFLSCVNERKKQKLEAKKIPQLDTTKSIVLMLAHRPANPRDARANNERRYDIKVKYRADYRVVK